MLIEIQCDKFISNETVRKPIAFHKGLNTVLGSSSGANSIGKSTFLMIIDFVFGGNDYADKAFDVLKNVGPHAINFAFEFDNAVYYFSRSPLYPKEVNKCNSNYETIETISLEKYQDFLHEKYKIESSEQSFRGAVGNYFRVYLRECCDEGHPLKSANRAPDEDGILELIKLFNQYEKVSAVIKELNLAKKKEGTYKKAISFGQISAPSNKSEYKKNADEISRLACEIDELLEKNESGLLDIDSVTAKQIAEIKGELAKLRRQRTRMKSQLSVIADENSCIVKLQKDFSNLLHYFPNADVKTLEEVEQFHAELTDALSEEVKREKDNLEGFIEIASNEIADLESRLKAIQSGPNVSKTILQHYADVSQKSEDLRKANEHFDEKQRLRILVSDLKEQVSEIFKEELFVISAAINGKMAEYNAYIYSENHSSPYINIRDESHYEFDTPNDRGTGSRYKGLILFDLSILSLTKLPVVAHDSFMLKQIEDAALEKLLELYSKTDKQVFIAMDKEETYTARTQEILRDSTVLRLSPGGNELFGKSWNVISQDSKTEQM